MNFKVYIISASILFSVPKIQAQTWVNSTISFGSYSGIEKFQILKKDTIQLRNGNYSFNSELIASIVSGSIQLKELLINGNYSQNLKKGVWNYRYNTFFLHDINLSKSWNVTLQHKLNGIADEFKIQYDKGNFNGSSTYSRRNITNGRFGNPKKIAEINFVNDTIIGTFEVSTDGIEMKGKTDKKGYLDGILFLRYGKEGASIIEKRNYKNGFLLEIEKLKAETGEQIVKITFDDVIQMLSQIENKNENLNFKVSDNFFGLKFNIGYQQNDEKVTEQHQGNEIIEKYIHLFDSIHNNYSTDQKKYSILKFTNRFLYLYDFDKDSLVTQLLKENNILKEKIIETLNKPNLILRKNSSNTLFQQYQILNYLKSKSDTLQVVFDKITSGYFDYRAIKKYYSSGIPGLNKPDTLEYIFGNDTLPLPIRFNHEIRNSDSLIYQIRNYIEELKEKINKTISNLSKSLTIYENQEKIDSLDNVISTLDLKISKKYSGISSIEKGDLSKASFSYKVYESLHDRYLGKLKSKYLNNSLSQEEMIALGSLIICYYTFLDSNQTYLDKIGSTQKYWNDSLFTIYRDNPFDFRKLETKILDGVQNASNILLRHYANQLLNAKNCEQINEELNKIKRLDNRIQLLVKNQHLDNVQQLNKALRRERVTNRIERLLEL
jgi:hypothetical protein